MDNIAEAVALLRRQAELEIRLANNPSARRLQQSASLSTSCGGSPPIPTP